MTRGWGVNPSHACAHACEGQPPHEPATSAARHRGGRAVPCRPRPARAWRNGRASKGRASPATVTAPERASEPPGELAQGKASPLGESSPPPGKLAQGKASPLGESFPAARRARAREGEPPGRAPSPLLSEATWPPQRTSGPPSQSFPSRGFESPPRSLPRRSSAASTRRPASSAATCACPGSARARSRRPSSSSASAATPSSTRRSALRSRAGTSRPSTRRGSRPSAIPTSTSASCRRRASR